MATLRTFYIVTCTYIFKVTKFLEIYTCAISGKGATFIDADTLHRLETLRMQYTVTLTYIFKVTQFLEIQKYTIHRNRRELAKNAQVRLL